ncbi:MAG TPA: hypothetical protein VFP54_12510 [Acidimicrobiales bacterium]|nr:hypothetical protein [Acidimicrobiales bacterium]
MAIPATRRSARAAGRASRLDDCTRLVEASRRAIAELVESTQAIPNGGRRLEALIELDLADAELARARARLHRLQRCNAGS